MKTASPPTTVPEIPPERGSGVEAIIPYRNVPALVGYYLGIFSLIPFLGLLFSLPAIGLGVAGLVRGLRHPEKRGKVHAIVAIICGVLGAYNYVLIVVIILGTRFGGR